MSEAQPRVEYYGYRHWTLENPPRQFNVGKGLAGRANSHHGRNHKWHAVVERYGLSVEVCTDPMEHFDACAWEIKTIAETNAFTTNHSHDDLDDIRCNFTRGGEGAAGRPVSAETRKKASDAQKGEKSAWFGRKHTDKVKQQISTKNTGKIRNAETRAEISATLVGKKVVDRGPGWRQKIGESNSRRKGIKLRGTKIIRKKNGVKNQLVLLCGGPDRCGKTNILKELEKRLGVPYFKASNERQNFVSGQDRFLNELRYAGPRVTDMLYQTGMSILIDRDYMCEWVYSQFFGRETDMHVLRAMDNDYNKMGAKILICTRKSFAGIHDDLDPRLDEVALQRLSELYAAFTKWTKCSTHTLYVDDEDLEREVAEVMTFLTVNKL